MPAITFPQIDSIMKFSLSLVKPSNRKISTAGYTMATSLATVSKRKILLSWEKVTFTDVETINTFFNTYQGTSFELNYPMWGTVCVVMFMQDEVVWDFSNEDTEYFGTGSTTIEFREV